MVVYYRKLIRYPPRGLFQYLEARIDSIPLHITLHLEEKTIRFMPTLLCFGRDMTLISLLQYFMGEGNSLHLTILSPTMGFLVQI